MGARPVCSLVVRSRWKILLFVMVDPCTYSTAFSYCPLSALGFRMGAVQQEPRLVTLFCYQQTTQACGPTTRVVLAFDMFGRCQVLLCVVAARTRSPAFCRMFRKSRGLRTHGATTVSYRLGRPGS